jgi:hypothetical protein
MSTPKLHIYLLKSPYGSRCYDTYSDCVLISVENARFIYSNNQIIWNTKNKQWSFNENYDDKKIPYSFDLDDSWKMMLFVHHIMLDNFICTINL